MNIPLILQLNIIYAIALSQFVAAIDVGRFFNSWLGSSPTLQPSSVRNHTSINPMFRFAKVNQTQLSKSYSIKSNNSTGPVVFKHEFEDEYPDPEETTPKPNKPVVTQEIDETKPDVSCKSASSTSNSLKNSINGAYSKTKKKEIEKFQSIKRKHKPITITNTVVKIATKYATVFPSCVKFVHVSRVCDGGTIMIKPTPTAYGRLPSSTTYKVNEALDERPAINASPDSVSPSEASAEPHMGISFESSDYDNEFESLESGDVEDEEHETHKATPELRSGNQMKENQSTSRKLIPLGNVLAHKYVIQTKVVSIAKTITTTDYAVTATLIASNCVPRDIQMPLCKPNSVVFPEMPTFPMVP